MADVEELLFSDNNDWMFQDTKDLIGQTSDGFDFFKTLSHEQLLSNAPLDTTLLAQYDASLASSPMSGFGVEIPVSPQSDLLSGAGTDSSSDEDYSANGSQEEFTDFSALMNTFHPETSSPESLSPVMTSSSVKKQKKKRKINQTCDAVQFHNSSGKFVELCEDDLIKLDSQKMECYIQAIHNERTLTAAEEKELKRIRRLIKNREYAQSSRNKKKQHVEDMQSQINVVKDENTKLNSKIQQLELENNNLKLQLGKIVQAISSDPEMAAKLKLDASTFNTPASQPSPSPSKRKRSAVLFVFLFSLALFVTPSIFSSSFSGSLSSGYEINHFATYRQILQSSNAEIPVWTKAVSFLPDQFQEWIHRNYLNQLEKDTCLQGFDCTMTTDNVSATEEPAEISMKQEPCDSSIEGCTQHHPLYSSEMNSTGL